MSEKKVVRKAENELEMLRLIIQENPILFNRVLNRLREQRDLSKQSIFDAVKQKQEAQKNKG